ncbi:MAG: antitoxin [Planctomycetes bacterium]|nr:antitoxin [Planctomycetota bacterium]
MSRISIDVTPQQHQRLKAMAALQGMSIKEFVLAHTLGLAEENRALNELEALLDQRLENARQGQVSSRTVQDILQVVQEEDSRRDPLG